MSIRAGRWCAVVASLVLASGGASTAAESSDPSPETRREMAAVHEKMATCLKSERPFAECREEMMKGCQHSMGGKGCPMLMGHGGMGMGPGMGHGPHGTPPVQEPKK